MSLKELRNHLRADFSRNVELADRMTLIVVRSGQYAFARGGLVYLLWRMIDFVYLRLLVGAEIPPDVKCGPGLRLPHGGRGVVINPGVVIGRDAFIYHRVTIGARGDGPPPRLGDQVYIGTGACVLGPISIGDGTRIGANDVVLSDSAPGALLAGVPAKDRRDDRGL